VEKIGKEKNHPLARKGREVLFSNYMNRILVQIYEIQEKREVLPLLDLGIDHLGTVIMRPEEDHWPPLKGTVEAIRAGGRKSVILPLFSSPAEIFHALSYFTPDLVHFCEAFSPKADDDFLSLKRARELVNLQWEIKEKFPGIGIMRSLPIPRPGRVDAKIRDNLFHLVEILSPYSDYFLLDTWQEGAQPVQGFVGITGEVCDWSLARQVVEMSPRPVILAGGLGPDNVAEAIRYVRPAGVDSCSRTNAQDERGKPIRFRKDLRLVSLFVREVKRINLLPF
jgi:phosphoribosylanthranilate isomerase